MALLCFPYEVQVKYRAVRCTLFCTADALVTQLEVGTSQQVQVRDNLQPIPAHWPWGTWTKRIRGQQCKRCRQTCPYPEQDYSDQGASRTVQQCPGILDACPCQTFALVGRSLQSADIPVNRQFLWELLGILPSCFLECLAPNLQCRHCASLSWIRPCKHT